MRLSKAQSRADHEEGDKPTDITAIGIWLKTEREKRNESLDRVSSVTRIGRPYLEAIEDGDLSKLPGQAYIRGFIRLYAAHLELSADDTLRLLEQGASNQIVPAENISATTSPGSSVRAATRPWFLYTMAALIIISASAYALFFYTPGGKTAPPKTPDFTIAPPAIEQPAVPPAVNKPVIPNAQPADKLSAEQSGNASPHEGLVLRLKAVRDAKMHITIDSSVSQEYGLIAGDVVEWKADTSFQIDLDNAAAVEAELDGKQLASFGDAGKGAHLVITRSGVQQN
jgi:cytoskeletal protein RodZ